MTEKYVKEIVYTKKNTTIFIKEWQSKQPIMNHVINVLLALIVFQPKAR